MTSSLNQKLLEIEKEVGADVFLQWMNNGREYLRTLSARPNTPERENEIIYNRVIASYVDYKSGQIAEGFRGVVK